MPCLIKLKRIINNKDIETIYSTLFKIFKVITPLETINNKKIKPSNPVSETILKKSEFASLLLFSKIFK